MDRNDHDLDDIEENNLRGPIELEDHCDLDIQSPQEHGISIKEDPICVLNVELQQGNCQILEIFSDSAPEKLAYDFCQKNNLDLASLKYLTAQITGLLRELQKGTFVQNQKGGRREENAPKRENSSNRAGVECSSSHSQKLANEHLERNFRKDDGYLIDKGSDKEVGCEKMNDNLCGKSGKKNTNNLHREVNNEISSQNSETVEDTKKVITNINQEGNDIDKNKANMVVIANPNENVSSRRLFSYQLFMDHNKHAKEGHNVKLLKNNKQLLNANSQKKSNITSFDDRKDCKQIGRDIINQDTMIQQLLYHFNSPRSCEYNDANKSTNYLIHNKGVTTDNGVYINYGERLYRKGLKLQEKTNKKLEKIKSEIFANSSETCTYQPQINYISPEFNQKRIEGNKSYNSDEYILNYKTYIENKLLNLKEKHTKKIEYSFSPQINRKSVQIDNRKSKVFKSSSPGTRHDALYEMHKNKYIKLEQIASKFYRDCSFKPNISESANLTISENSTFQERQQAFITKSKENKEKLRELVYNPVDSKTGQTLFQPLLLNQVNIQKKLHRHTSNIFQTLYAYAQKYQVKHIQKENEIELKDKHTRESSHIGYDSEIMFQRRKEEAFKRIFQFLDSDEDNLISVLSMERKKIPENILNILQPIFIELKQDNETLNVNEFVRACDKLYEMIPFQDKRALLNVNEKVASSENNCGVQFTFKPTIDRNSKKIAENKLPLYYPSPNDRQVDQKKENCPSSISRTPSNLTYVFRKNPSVKSVY